MSSAPPSDVSISDEEGTAPPRTSNGIESEASTSFGPSAHNTQPQHPQRPLPYPSRRPAIPLTSFANTPQNIAAIAFLLGIVFQYGLSYATKLPTFLIEGSDVADDQRRWGGVLRSPLLGVYLASWAFFHLMEYLVTATFNPAKGSVSSYLLNNGTAYHIAHGCGLLELALEEMFAPGWYLKLSHSPLLILAGILLIVFGQFVRSLAMITASTNFTHIVAYRKSESHELVTHGIYSFSRHPSYLAFFFWAIGTQILMGNVIAGMGFAVVLWRFFHSRIQAEERYLLSFFGDKYADYRKRVPTRIPFMR